MTPNRWFLLRHPEGFPEPLFRAFRAQCRIWRATLEATVESWDDLSYGRLAVPKPRYEFGEPDLSEDRTIASLALGGELSHGAMKILEDDFPHALMHDFPLWFRLDLELGRRDLLGWFPETRWWPAVDPEKAAELRRSPLFQRR